ncbi:vomeronasal type-2 receptor 26 isoform X1 [Cricetulus griseus]|uniref:vomeronasal type-2 receptor 26 isoform X1 n=1 Tax=Cricetulus griseus TaxID=10029 RepID=UPI000F745157|nr:vomeronasal type-2 receptor 26 isoform X1 [Cricetulus griseus]
MIHEKCSNNWNPTTYMYADIILGTFIPIYITQDFQDKFQIPFKKKPNLFDIVIQVDREMPTVVSVHFMSPRSGFNFFSPIDSNVPRRGSTLFTRESKCLVFELSDNNALTVLIILPLLFREKWKNYQYLLTLYFAIEEINKDAHLLPNVTLGFHLYNAFHSHRRTLEGPLMWLSERSEFIPNYKCKTQHKALGIIAGIRPEFSAAIGTLLELYKIPQVTYGLFHSVLSDKDTFPSVYQISPQEKGLTQGVICLLLHFGWKWVGLIVADDIHGREFLSDLTAELASEDICVAFTEKIPTFMKVDFYFGVGLVNLSQHTKVNVRVFYGDIDDVLIFYIQNEIISKRKKMWIMAKPNFVYLQSVFYKWIGLMPSVSIWNAVYAVAHALHEMLLSKTEIDSHKDINQDRLLPWQLHPFLRKIQFTNAAGDQICFDEKKNPMEKYDIQNFVGYTNHDSFVVKVGEFVSKSPQDKGLFINEVLIKWPSNFNQNPQSVCSESCGPGFWKLTEEGRPACCFSCVFCPERHISNQTDQQKCIPCPIQQYPNPERNNCLPKSMTFLSLEDSLGLALVCVALCFSVSTAVVLGIFLKHQDSPIIKANNRTLSFILLISLLLCFMCTFLFIGQPSTASCILQQITFALVFTLVLSTVLAKTITVVLAFRVVKLGRTMRRLFVSGIYNSVIPICFLMQLILLGVWMGTSPPYIQADAHSEHSYIIILCNKGSVTAFYCVLAYLGILALGSFTVAFLARNLPDTFNESKFLTFSMLVFCSVWVTFLPVYHSTKNKAMVAVEVFSILASSAGLLGCIFIPKCYIILLRPDKNSLKCFKNKTKYRHNRLF